MASVVRGCPLVVCCVDAEGLLRGVVLVLVVLLACVALCDVGGSNDTSTSLYSRHLAPLFTDFGIFA